MNLLKPLETVFAELNVVQDTKFYKIKDLGSLISAVVSLMLIVSALLAFFYLILGGIQWITSGGEKSAMEAARNKITHAIVGLIIVGAAWAIMTLVQNFLGVTLIGPNVQLPQPW